MPFHGGVRLVLFCVLTAGGGFRLVVQSALSAFGFGELLARLSEEPTPLAGKLFAQ